MIYSNKETPNLFRIDEATDDEIKLMLFNEKVVNVMATAPTLERVKKIVFETNMKISFTIYNRVMNGILKVRTRK